MATHVHTTTRGCRVLIGLAVLLGLIGLAERGSCASASDADRETLRGLPGMSVLVESLEPDVERAGLTTHQLQIDVELQLRKAGIRIFTKEESLRVPGHPLVYVNAFVLLHPKGQAAYFISIALHQWASLAANASSTLVETWATGYLGLVGVNSLNTLRGNIRDCIDQLINDYLSVNPRPAGSTAPSSTSPRRDLIRQVQERLQAVGFNPGTIDGAMGPQTQQALRWFQNAKGLVATGDLDGPTLDALGVR
jgi:hypothetical protein